MKDSSFTVTLPCLQLADRLVYLPGVTYRTVLTKADGARILSKFTEVTSMLNDTLRQAIRDYYIEHKSEKPAELSHDGLQGIELLGKFNRSISGAPLMACLPGVEGVKTKGCAICQITEVQELQYKTVLWIKAHYRGRSVTSTVNDHDEAVFTVDTSDSHASEFDDKTTRSLAFEVILPKTLQLFVNIDKFVDDYRAGERRNTDDDLLKHLLLRLSPLASLMYSELSGAETSAALHKLQMLYLSVKTGNHTLTEYRHLFQLNDILVAVFGFSCKQKVEILGMFDGKERLHYFHKLIDFANNLFEKYLDIEFVLEQWKRMDEKMGPEGGRILKTQFIRNYLRNLRRIIEEVGTASSHGKAEDRKAESQGAVAAGGDNDDTDIAKVQKFIQGLEDYCISEDGKRLIYGDFRRMMRMAPSSSDFQVLRTYMDVIMDIPWLLKTDNTDLLSSRIDLETARDQLNADHYGMQSVKERILEYLAVLKLQSRIRIRRNSFKQKEKVMKARIPMRDSSNATKFVAKWKPSKPTQSADGSPNTMRAPILLLTGPPGVGKTSLAQSVASTLGRKFQRVSLGGLNDFADLKGHRRTYVGAIPGLIVQALRRAQSSNPVILLDEVDKIGGASRNGNPEAALLEILDPEQNSNFQDHYIGFPIDLSQILFICTANNQWEICPPLRDRMEIIPLAGYSYYEKLEICKKFIIPRQVKQNALQEGLVQLDDPTILKLATEYTNESGIRSLERLVSSICRSKAIEYSNLMDTCNDDTSIPSGYTSYVTIEDLPRYIGYAGHVSDSYSFGKRVTAVQELYGIANGLSYNSDGSGSLLNFEMVGLPGDKSLSCTGNLGDVLLESAEIADTLVGFLLNKRMLTSAEGDFDDEAVLRRFNKTEVHLHVPEGAISKDGPSAGITMTICLLSLILQKAIPSSIAMTGEITLTGKILPIGGLKEKLLAAHLTGKINKVLIPRANRKDIIEDYTSSMSDRTQARDLLSTLMAEQDRLLKTDSNKESWFRQPEQWVKRKLGITLIYVEDLADVITAVWNGDIVIRKLEHNYHSSKVRSHI
ncbi:hypothetical protein FOA43_003877 [Brettanomyces nanus]|uniref:Lon protease homolog 2, peroxisomal n=1 Tax=Eeniella nana TaxID=13502 RepID=A0A875S6B9_EENNA|nr:uncharacterized protein FOA43_003877 [Brettanomyces nanus]QPG76488.1 hypothetical protein FOA43_003877 [Brettanomyces nanus]